MSHIALVDYVSYNFVTWYLNAISLTVSNFKVGVFGYHKYDIDLKHDF